MKQLSIIPPTKEGSVTEECYIVLHDQPGKMCFATLVRTLTFDKFTKVPPCIEQINIQTKEDFLEALRVLNLIASNL